jgi:predicted amidohydrolase YtcJ
MSRCAIALAILAAVVTEVSGEAPTTVDLLIVHARIWTGDAKNPEADLVAVANGRVVYIGKQADFLLGDNTIESAKKAIPCKQALDLHGKRVVPGFYDSHVHLLGGGSRLSEVRLKDAKDEEDFGKRLQEFDKKLPRDQWMLGGNWDHDRALKGELPTAALIDMYVKDRPVFLRRYDGHMAIANSRALKLAGIDANTKEVSGGVIYRKEGGTEPTGLLRDTAMSLVERVIPPPTDTQIATAVRDALAEIRANGVTSIQDMDGSDSETRRKLFRLYQHMARDGTLTCRINLRWPILAWRELDVTGIGANFGNDFVRIGGVKGFIDGSLGSTTAKFFEPYLNEPNSTGIYVTPRLAMRLMVGNADKAGLNVAVHAIGDQGNATMLDIYAEAIKANGARDRRFRIEHAQHLRPVDIPRFKEFGVIASMQPYHIIDDGRWAEGRIGPERCATSYANRSLLDAGATLAFGSDWPVAPLNVLEGIDAAVNRRTLDGKHLEGWFPQQKITVEEALRAYTWGSAYAGFQEKERGTLAPGYFGDCVVLSRDILDPKERDHIAETEVLMTIVGGKLVYEKK